MWMNEISGAWKMSFAIILNCPEWVMAYICADKERITESSHVCTASCLASTVRRKNVLL